MAKPHVVEDKNLDYMLKATAGYSRTPERDVVLLLASARINSACL